MGAPVWRYHRGKAVVIGVIFDTIPKLGRRACEEKADSVVMVTNVGAHRDWITGVIDSNWSINILIVYFGDKDYITVIS